MEDLLNNNSNKLPERKYLIQRNTAASNGDFQRESYQGDKPKSPNSHRGTFNKGDEA